MKAECVRITLRIPPEVHAVAVDLAKKLDRSLNWQLVNMLKVAGAAAVAEKEKP